MRSLDYFSSRYILYIYGYGLWVKTIYVQYVNPKIAGEWMFILLELIIIGFDPPPYVHIYIYMCMSIHNIGLSEMWITMVPRKKKAHHHFNYLLKNSLEGVYRIFRYTHICRFPKMTGLQIIPH